MHLSTTTADIRVLRLIDNHEEFVRLPLKAQGDLLAKLDWMDRIERAGQGHKEAVTLAASRDLGVSPGAVRRYRTWFKCEGWRGLLDTRGKGIGSKGTPEAFQDWIRQLHLQHQRATTGREVQRVAIERWNKWRRTGDPKWSIPGYDVPPPAGPQGHPKGWSEDQILRLRPEGYALAVARQGEKAGSKFLPSILKTRFGTRFGEVVFFDDQDYDHKIVAPGFSQRSLRPQGFNALDYLSGCFMEYCIRLRWWDLEKEQYRTLTGIEATWFILTYLLRHGYRTDGDGTMLVVEHGTMKGYDNRSLHTPGGQHSLADALVAVTGGKVRTMASGLFNSPAFAGMLFRPQSSGNPNTKAPLESMFNLVRNRFAAIEGGTGRNRDLKPAEQYGQDKYVEQLLKVWARLDERHQAVMQFPLLTAGQFGEAAFAVYQAINARRDHALEGWARCGHVVPEFRWTPDERTPWIGQQELAGLIAQQPQIETAAHALMAIPGHVRQVNLAPIEVADLHRGELTKLPDHYIPLLIPREWAKEVTVTSDREIHVKDQLLGPEPFVFTARIRERDGAFTLKPGTKLLGYLNPFDTSRLYVCRADGSWLGTMLAKTRAGFLDQEAIVGQLQERAALKADMDLEVRPHLEGLMQHRGEMKRVNDRLTEGRPVLPEEIAEARHDAGVKGQRTAAANRLQRRGSDREFDDLEPASAPSASEQLQDDDTEIPEAF